MESAIGLSNQETNGGNPSGRLGLERLDRDGVMELVGLAQILAAAQREPLDEPALRLLTSLQV